MSGDISYELHAYSGGKWKIQGFFDDKDLALTEVRRMEEGRRYPALRVVEERYDHDAGVFKARTVYRTSATDQDNDAILKQRAEMRRENEEIRRQNREAQKQKAQVRAKRSAALVYTLIAAKAVAIFAFGFGALYALNQLSAG